MFPNDILNLARNIRGELQLLTGRTFPVPPYYRLGQPQVASLHALIDSPSLFHDVEASELSSKLHFFKTSLPQSSTGNVMANLVQCWFSLLTSNWLTVAPVIQEGSEHQHSYLLGIRRIDYNLLDELVDAASALRAQHEEAIRSWAPDPTMFRVELLDKRLRSLSLPIVGVAHSSKNELPSEPFNPKRLYVPTSPGWIAIDWEEQPTEAQSLIAQRTSSEHFLEHSEANRWDRSSNIVAETYEHLARRFGIYQGRQVTGLQVKAYVEQFQEHDRPAVVSLLQSVKHYSEILIREQLVILHNKVSRLLSKLGLPGNVVLSASGAPSKSNYRYTRLYKQENELETSEIRPINTLQDGALISGKALVFVDDIIGSGETAQKILAHVRESHGEYLEKNNVTLILAAICAYEEAIVALRESKEKFPVHVVAANVVGRCFDPNTKIFDSELLRLEAETVAKSYGERLLPGLPFGFDDGQALIVFDDNCPDNSLPILWHPPTGALPNWIPLFPRA